MTQLNREFPLALKERVWKGGTKEPFRPRPIPTLPELRVRNIAHAMLPQRGGKTLTTANRRQRDRKGGTFTLIGGEAGGLGEGGGTVGGREREVSAVPDGAVPRPAAVAAGKPPVSAAGFSAASWRPSGFTWAAHQLVWPSIR